MRIQLYRVTAQRHTLSGHWACSEGVPTFWIEAASPENAVTIARMVLGGSSSGGVVAVTRDASGEDADPATYLGWDDPRPTQAPRKPQRVAKADRTAGRHRITTP